MSEFLAEESIDIYPDNWLVDRRLHRYVRLMDIPRPQTFREQDSGQQATRN